MLTRSWALTKGNSFRLFLFYALLVVAIGVAALVVGGILGIVFAALYSVLLFDDHIPTLGWLGMALIVGSGILATVLRARSTRNPA